MTMKINLLIIAMLVITTSFTYSKSKTKMMKITPSQAAPAFTIKDVDGNTVKLSDFKGKKVLLSFYRNVGCPVCNVRFHELQEQSDYFKTKGLVVLAVYESTPEHMKQYLSGEAPYAIMIPNADLSLYKLYEVEQSMGKVMKGMFHGAMGKMKEGKRLFKRKMKQDGSMSRIGADFLIDKQGNVKTAYYGKYLGDHVPISDIKKFLN